MDGGRIVSYGCWCDPVRSLRELIPTEVGAEETGNIENIGNTVDSGCLNRRGWEPSGSHTEKCRMGNEPGRNPIMHGILL